MFLIVVSSLIKVLRSSTENEERSETSITYREIRKLKLMIEFESLRKDGL